MEVHVQCVDMKKRLLFHDGLKERDWRTTEQDNSFIVYKIYIYILYQRL